jgi:hypothetical protein
VFINESNLYFLIQNILSSYITSHLCIIILICSTNVTQQTYNNVCISNTSIKDCNQNITFEFWHTNYNKYYYLLIIKFKLEFLMIRLWHFLIYIPLNKHVLNSTIRHLLKERFISNKNYLSKTKLGTDSCQQKYIPDFKYLLSIWNLSIQGQAN